MLIIVSGFPDKFIKRNNPKPLLGQYVEMSFELLGIYAGDGGCRVINVVVEQRNTSLRGLR